MTDIENVIRGIKHESRNSGKCGHYCPEEYAAKCPYDPDGLCIIHWGADAIAMLKEQEPRVMTLEELLALPKDTPVFIEEDNGDCGWNVFYGIDEEKDVCFCGFRASADYYDLEEYGMSWRCWTSKPTDEQRMEARWVEM